MLEKMDPVSAHDHFFAIIYSIISSEISSITFLLNIIWITVFHEFLFWDYCHIGSLVILLYLG